MRKSMSDPILVVNVQGEDLPLYTTAASTAAGREEILDLCELALDSRNPTGYSVVNVVAAKSGDCHLPFTSLQGEGYPGHLPVENWLAWSNGSWRPLLDRVGDFQEFYAGADGIVVVLPIGAEAVRQMFPHAADVYDGDELFFTHWAWRPFLDAGVSGLEARRLNARAVWRPIVGDRAEFIAASVESPLGKHRLPRDGELGTLEEATALASVAGRAPRSATMSDIREVLLESLDQFLEVENRLVDQMVSGGIPLSVFSGNRVLQMQQQFVDDNARALREHPLARPFIVLGGGEKPVHELTKEIYEKCSAQGADAVTYAFAGPITLGPKERPLLIASEGDTVAVWVGVDTPLVLWRADGVHDRWYAIVEGMLHEVSELPT